MTPRINPIGISSHINWLSNADIDKQLGLMQVAGINWIRFDVPWSMLEKTQGTWDFSVFDYIFTNASARGMNILALLSQYNSPSWYAGTNPWNYPIDPTNYARYVSAFVTHFKGKIQLYEMGNEPNIDVFWYPQNDPVAYTALLKAGYEAVKAADPNAKVISGGLANISANEFLTNMYANGAKGYFDYLGFHPYSWPRSPDDTLNATNFAVSATLQQTMIANGDSKQIMATEVGWPSTIQSGGVTEKVQAQYIQRVFQKIEYEDFQYIALACIYDFVNDGKDASNAEDNFGLLHPSSTNYKQKPSYTTVQQVRADYLKNFTPINP